MRSVSTSGSQKRVKGGGPRLAAGFPRPHCGPVVPQRLSPTTMSHHFGGDGWESNPLRTPYSAPQTVLKTAGLMSSADHQRLLTMDCDSRESADIHHLPPMFVSLAVILAVRTTAGFERTVPNRRNGMSSRSYPSSQRINAWNGYGGRRLRQLASRQAMPVFATSWNRCTPSRSRSRCCTSCMRSWIEHLHTA